MNQPLVKILRLNNNSGVYLLISPKNSQKAEAQVSTQAVAAIIPPPPDIQPVIDKLAEYVARNGVKFEASVRAKNDPR